MRDSHARTILVALTLGSFLTAGVAPAVAGNPFDDVSHRIRFLRGSIGLFSEGIGGAAWLDYDNDGDLDLFLTNRPGRANALYRNKGNGHFKNVAWKAGVANGLGNKGALAGDIDNDGCVDLFLTGEGGMLGLFESPTKLYINNCDGTFDDISASAGIPGPVPGLRVLDACKRCSM